MTAAAPGGREQFTSWADEVAAVEARTHVRMDRVHAIASFTTRVLIHQNLVEHGSPTGETFTPSRCWLRRWLDELGAERPDQCEVLTPAVVRSVAAELLALADVMDAS